MSFQTVLAPSWAEKCVVAWKIEPVDEGVLNRGVGFCTDGEVIPKGRSTVNSTKAHFVVVGKITAYVVPGLLRVYADPQS